MSHKLRVLLLGRSGFVGKNFYEQLATKYTLLTPTHNQLNLLDEKKVHTYLKRTLPDVVIYAVNIGGTRKAPDTADIFIDNLRMFFNVAHCNKYYEKMIFLGSGAEYDKRNNLIKVREEEFGQSIPQDYYGFYKYLCSNYIERADKIVNLRIFGLFGKHEDYSIRFISNIIGKTIYNLPLTINQNVFFDYVYIDDFIRILDYFIIHQVKYKFYNIGTGQSIDLLSLAKKISLLNKGQQKIIVKKSGLGKEYTCNNSRLKRELYNFSFTPLDTAIKELFSWYERDKKRIKI